MGQVLAANAEPHDGLTGYLLRTLPGSAKAYFDMCESPFPYGVSEPNHWIIVTEKQIGQRAIRCEVTVDCVGTDFDDECFDDFRPIALVADGTFEPLMRH